ncbi:OprD family outer membrane porin [Azotobacter vinelandii CA]|uniref:OprD family outer membrane porin n=2 Tax=Azotobacter vinelandii TaxID=354 RepID=C1DPY3_AZOVD|nr:OprD family outer membrane porin [Azotobacter vinelandii]ACO79554.1 OprD family outer membrane porin [Azotobacter vinelandii DJ]AGK14645.1 OprD family outer membrane porin [Azotobacter vinelandii CA]AGK21321.1 OprD family outer membrane porin [Azotobacter vinelandii CA6]GLK58050.1 porin [Azotobacter vinelandii]
MSTYTPCGWRALALTLSTASIQPTMAAPQAEARGFAEEAGAHLMLRNGYVYRDNQDGVRDQSRWAQAFIASFDSGFSRGPVGVGLDAFGLLAVRLDTGKSRDDGDIAYFPTDSDGDTEEDLGELGIAFKLRISNTLLQYGDQLPALPVLSYDSSRLLPQTFRGVLLSSEEIDGLTLHAGRFTAQNDNNHSGRDVPGRELDSIELVGASYAFNERLSVALYFSDIEKVARKRYANIVWQLPLAEENTLEFDFDFYRTRYDRDYTRTGKGEDNSIWSLMGTYRRGPHAFILAWQRSIGGFENLDEDGQPVTHGYDFDFGDGGDANYLANAFYSDFNRKDERSWQIGYELDFADLGMPGLTWRTAYVHGSKIDTGRDGTASEREFYNQIQYVVPEGVAKDLSISLYGSIYRASRDLNQDLNEIWLFVDYPLDYP